MTVTVLPILETDFKPEKALAKVMNDRLIRTAKDLQDNHFRTLTGWGFPNDDLVVYISYNPKYKIRFRIVNDVPADVEYFVAECCGRLGFILWRANAIGVTNEYGAL
ncbi:hypothetical protein [Pedobacter soli]|uniref:Uncharacterized protein n=1 Tax=Pedobacter soli TaxID=390242 RepID=A0A1G6ZA30_9SPHI|nr:hypothetical protein [Pedobacter soli]SDD99332.1 hypothetical protein SAMN04488024_11029 [Pedobacter soli]